MNSNESPTRPSVNSQAEVQLLSQVLCGLNEVDTNTRIDYLTRWAAEVNPGASQQSANYGGIGAVPVVLTGGLFPTPMYLPTFPVMGPPTFQMMATPNRPPPGFESYMVP